MFGLFVQRHAEAAALFNDITVIYVHCDEQANQKFELEIQKNSVETIRVYFRKSKFKFLNLVRFFKANTMALRKTKRAEVFHVHVLTRLGIIALFYKKTRRTPYIVTEHWSRYLPGNDFHGFVRKVVTKMVVKNASTVTTVTENLASAMKGHGLTNKNYVILPNVVDVKNFHIGENKSDTVKIIHVSCFENKSKNISGLLDALLIMKANGVSFMCELVGDGMDFYEMKKYSEELQLGDRVHFTGLLQGEELADTLSSGDFLVISSNYENLPVVILEALASGLPIVSTNVGGIAEIVNDRNGLLVPPFDVEKLAEAMTSMCKRHNEYDKNYLRNTVASKYSVDRVGALLDKWYSCLEFRVRKSSL